MPRTRMRMAERVVRSMRRCLDRMTPFGEGHFQRAVTESVERYHRERNHQRLENALIDGRANDR